MKEESKLKRVFSFSFRKKAPSDPHASRSTSKLFEMNVKGNKMEEIHVNGTSPKLFNTLRMAKKNSMRSSKDRLVEFGITHEYIVHLKCDFNSISYNYPKEISNSDIKGILKKLFEAKKKYSEEDDNLLIDFSLGFHHLISPDELFSNIQIKFKKAKGKNGQMRLITVLCSIIRFNKSLLNKKIHPQVAESILAIEKMIDLPKISDKRKEFDELCLKNLNEQPEMESLKYPLKTSKTTVNYYSFNDLDSQKFAEQLTRAQQELFISIPVTEFAHYWKNIEEASDWSNLWGYIQLSNHLKYWVQTQIAISKDRHIALEFFIKLAGKCMGLGNYCSAHVIIQAVHETTLTAIVTSWAFVTKMDEFKSLHEWSSNQPWTLEKYLQLMQSEKLVNCLPVIESLLEPLKEQNQPIRGVALALKSIHILQQISSFPICAMDINIRDFIYDLPYFPPSLVKQLSNVALKDWELNFTINVNNVNNNNSNGDSDLLTGSPVLSQRNVSPSSKNYFKGSIMFKETSHLFCQVISGFEELKHPKKKYSLKESLNNMLTNPQDYEISTDKEKNNSEPKPREKRESILKLNSSQFIPKEKLTQLNYSFLNGSFKISDGSIAATLKHLIGDAGLGFDINFVESFIRTSGYMLKPKELLEFLTQIFPSNISWEWKVPFFNSKIAMRNRILIIISRWIKKEWMHLKEDHEFLKAFMSWTLTIQIAEEKIIVIQLIHTLNNSKMTMPLECGPDGFSKVNFLLQKQYYKELALRLTYIEQSMYKAIKPNELRHKNFQNSKEKTQIELIVERFNNMSNWVSMVVLGEELPEKRCEMICKFIKLANELKKKFNINNCYAIVAAINSNAITRMKQSWNKIGSENNKTYQTFQHLCDLFNPQANMKNLRKFISLHPNEIVCPFIGMYTKDIFGIEENNKNYLTEGIINFEKMEMLSNMIESTLKFQSIPDAKKKISNMFVKNENLVSDPIYKYEAIGDEHLYRLSLQREAKNQNFNNPLFSIETNKKN